MSERSLRRRRRAFARELPVGLARPLFTSPFLLSTLVRFLRSMIASRRPLVCAILGAFHSGGDLLPCLVL
jgi:hypothetical protein